MFMQKIYTYAHLKPSQVPPQTQFLKILLRLSSHSQPHTLLSFCTTSYSVDFSCHCAPPPSYPPGLMAHALQALNMCSSPPCDVFL